MRLTITMMATALALGACSKAEAPAPEANAAADNAAAAAPVAVAGTDEQTYEYLENGKPMVISIDESGGYVVEASGKHEDHGMTEMRDGKLCFASAMAEHKAEDACWTIADLQVGQSGDATSDKGAKIILKRVEYRPLST